MARKPSDTKQFYQYFDIPNIGNLSAGFPHPSFFPYDHIETKIAKPDRFRKVPSDECMPNVPSYLENGEVDRLSQSIGDLSTVLQYGTAQGYSPLRSFLRQFTHEYIVRDIPYLDGPDIIISCGNTDGFSQVLQLLTNTWSEGLDDVSEREGILCEEFSYTHAIQAAEPRGLQMVPVSVDADGLVCIGPGGLEEVLAAWDTTKGKRPHLLYTIPTGQNPTGTVASMKRRKEIYAICSRYDIIIIEDDPCWHLNYPSAPRLEASARGIPYSTKRQENSFPKSSGIPYIDGMEPSYLGLDVDGRVIRLDTFSKSIAPGCRLGWITAQPAVTQSLFYITEASTAQASGFVQAMVAQLLMGSQHAAKSEFAQKSQEEQDTFTNWDFENWLRWLEGVRGRYESRMNRMCAILEEGRHIQVTHDSPTQLFTFSWPRGGMSVWIRMNFHLHPLAGEFSGPALAHAMWRFMLQKPQRVLVTPGGMFSPTDKIRDERGWKYFRLCFAPVTEEELENTSRRFVLGVQAFWAINSRVEVEEIERVDPFED
ncbi:hypothetical protein TWF694_003198 [Orbilia ellipsospora]|uniref:Aminotransferase class I/classII large domain-containing protein n=1 Tax=Orbilia ellipsospora TaxID=2528407 RepID=A0AAV9X0S9_9PEZI